MGNFKSTFEYKLIYVFRINDKKHKDLVKIGDATVHTTKSYNELFENCKELNQAAKERINSYTVTAGIEYELLHTELAIYTEKNKVKAFRDKKVHDVLIRSGIKRHSFNIESQGLEWFETDLETTKKAIKAVKNNKSSLLVNDISEGKSPIIFRPEQKDAIEKTVKLFKKSDRMLWNAKMRFGKTLSALEVAKRLEFKKTLIFTHRPVVSDGWYEDFNQIFYDTNYKFGSKTRGETIENLVDSDFPFVYFASIQDLRGSAAVGGKFDKNEFLFLIDWDFIIVDEAHEGTQTTLGQKVLEEVLGNNDKIPKLLELSGTPFNLLSNFKEEEIYTWDYIMEQKAKATWELSHFGDSNPYEELPKLEIYTYSLDKIIKGYVDLEDSAFNFREFFRTWTGDIKKDFKPIPNNVKIGDFVHRDDVWSFLDLLTKEDKNTNYPFSTREYRSYYKHTLWIVPGVKEAKALSALMKEHPVFGCGEFEIVNVAGNGDEEENYRDALKAVRKAIGKNPDDHYSITISCGRLTTGVTVPEWTAVLMLAGSFSTSASSYLQTIFRVQTPANINGKMKEYCSVFDFAPDRTLKMVAEAGHLSSATGNVNNDRIVMGEFLNYCPVIGIDGSSMATYNVDSLLQQLKRAYTDRVVKNGFDDKHLYNDNLLKLDDIELQDFEELKKIIGSTKQTKKSNDIDINNQGLTNEEYEEIQRIEKKPKKERTAEEIALLEEKKKKKDNAQKAMSILRGISIRIPLLIYGAEIPFEQDITADNFVNMIDDASWNEFMPSGVTKEKYRKFAKYYEQDVFVAAGRQIRNMAKSADELPPTERVKKIAEIFSMFKNPDKETVLTPWRVVNMHMSECLGGYNFYNEEFDKTLDEPVFVDRGKVTADTFANPNAKILEINSKTGLYPLYVTYSIFRSKIDKMPKNELTDDTVWYLWKETVKNNLFVICKTPMAKAITKRTLLGYKQGKVNAHYFEDLINKLKNEQLQFIDKVTRGSYWNREEQKMKFDAIVGNPPYQVDLGNTSGNSSKAKAIYHLFVEASQRLTPNYLSMIMPSRWMTKTTEGIPDDWVDKMLKENKLEVLFDYLDATMCFKEVEIKGGICYFLWNPQYEGRCKYVLSDVNNEVTTYYDYLDTLNVGIVIRDKQAHSIMEKIVQKEGNYFDNDNNNFSGIVSPKDFYTNKQKLTSSWAEFSLEENNIYSIKCYLNKNIHKIDFAWVKLEDIPKNRDTINKNKVYIPAAGGTGTDSQILGYPFVGDKNSVCTQTYLAIGYHSDFSKNECINIVKYIKTKIFRYLVSIKKKTQNGPRMVYQFVPTQDFTEKSDIDWSKSIHEIDQQLYAKYNLTQEEINFIETTIKPME